MRTSQFADLRLSKLMLGTCQFGMEYGIANKVGQPSYEAAREIIACAYEGGVNCLDTAALYGNCEEVLGKALAELGIADDVVVVTKLCKLAGDCSQQVADEIVEQSVTTSLKRLKLDALPICMFHRAEDFRYVESLLKMKERGLVKHVGCSVSSVEGGSEIAASGLAEAVQIPTNILDHRYIRAGVLQSAMDKGKALFVRSVWLQGLILMPEKDIPAYLAEVIPVRRQLEALAAEAGITMAELAMCYVLSLEGVNCVVVGVDTVGQMKQNLEPFSKPSLDASLLQAVAQTVPDLPDAVLVPGNWSDRIKDTRGKRRPEAEDSQH